MSFKELGLSPKVISAVEAAGYENPTPIQTRAIPMALAGRDVLGIAQTGTGKTAGFVLPMLTRLERGRARARMPRSLILEPTRELAAQVAAAFETYGVNHKLTVALLIGGVSFDEQYKKLDRGADVVIATPGRLLDHSGRGKLLLNACEILVIDEADRMLDMGFIPDIERICKLLPPKRQTLFFSATMPPEIQHLADQFLQDPERIEVAPPASTSVTITQRLKFVDGGEAKDKRAALRELMRGEEVRNAIVFCNRKRDVAILHRSLVKHGFNAAALHGDLEQFQRTATLESFRNGEVTYLAASDVAARGLDIPEVSHVFNYDVPSHPEDYVHRIGRTGRAGREGMAATLVTSEDVRAVKAIERLLRQEIEWLDDAPSDEALASKPKGRGRGRGKPRRRGGKDEAKTTDRTRSDSDRGRRESTTARAEKSGDPAPKKKRRSSAPRKSPGKTDNGKKSGMGDHVPAFMREPIRSPT